MRIFLLVLILSPLILNAQYFRDPKIPKPEISQYESFQTKSTIQTTADFQLKGPVKSLCETLTGYNSITDQMLFHKKEYLFSGNHHLLYYSRDTTSTLYDYMNGAQQMTYTYDSAGRLLESVTSYFLPGDASKRIQKWSPAGFIEQENYSSSRRPSAHYGGESGTFDYTLDYQWSAHFDSVSLKYHYLKPNASSPYERQSDRTYSFVRELNEKKKDQSKDKLGSVVSSPGEFQFVTNELKTDDRGRITEWIVWDFTIKSSINVHQKTEYSYNERDELTEIRYFSTNYLTSNNEFQLHSRVKMEYVSYDSYGNWTERKLVFDPDNNSGYAFGQKRELVYY